VKGRMAATALAGALVAVVIVGVFLALDRTVLHVYYSESVASITPPTATQVTARWYYIPERVVRQLTQRYGNTLPPCTDVTTLYPRALPAPVNGPPLVTVSGSEGETQSTVQLAVECRQ
jgi:hypothetical protein